MPSMRGIFDPNGIFNANKIVDTPPMDKSLRYEKETSEIAIDTVFDFSGQENILRLSAK